MLLEGLQVDVVLESDGRKGNDVLCLACFNFFCFNCDVFFLSGLITIWINCDVFFLSCLIAIWIVFGSWALFCKGLSKQRLN